MKTCVALLRAAPTVVTTEFTAVTWERVGVKTTMDLASLPASGLSAAPMAEATVTEGSPRGARRIDILWPTNGRPMYKSPASFVFLLFAFVAEASLGKTDTRDERLLSSCKYILCRRFF